MELKAWSIIFCQHCSEPVPVVEVKRIAPADSSSPVGLLLCPLCVNDLFPNLSTSI